MSPLMTMRVVSNQATSPCKTSCAPGDARAVGKRFHRGTWIADYRLLPGGRIERICGDRRMSDAEFCLRIAAATMLERNGASGREYVSPLTPYEVRGLRLIDAALVRVLRAARKA